MGEFHTCTRERSARVLKYICPYFTRQLPAGTRESVPPYINPSSICHCFTRQLDTEIPRARCCKTSVGISRREYRNTEAVLTSAQPSDKLSLARARFTRVDISKCRFARAAEEREREGEAKESMWISDSLDCFVCEVSTMEMRAESKRPARKKLLAAQQSNAGAFQRAVSVRRRG